MSELFQGTYRIQSARFVNWDYRWASAYFITICTHDGKHAFGDIANGKMNFSQVGQLADTFWREILNHTQNVELGEFVVMPNHVHGILILKNPWILDDKDDALHRYDDNVMHNAENANHALHGNANGMNEGGNIINALHGNENGMNNGENIINALHGNDYRFGMNDGGNANHALQGDDNGMHNGENLIKAMHGNENGMNNGENIINALHGNDYRFGMNDGGNANHAMHGNENGMNNGENIINALHGNDYRFGDGVQTLHATSLPTPKNKFMASISPKPNSISTIIRSYKSAVTKHANLLGIKFKWQTRFHDHIIRDDRAFQNISNYIINNPKKWSEDKFHKK